MDYLKPIIKTAKAGFLAKLTGKAADDAVAAAGKAQEPLQPYFELVKKLKEGGS